MDWKTLLAYITGTVDQELLVRNEYLVTENRLLRHQLKGRLRLTDGERKTLAAIGQKLGKQALKEVATIVKPDTILAWHRTLVAQKCDGSPQRKPPGRQRSALDTGDFLGHVLAIIRLCYDLHGDLHGVSSPPHVRDCSCLLM